MARTYILDGKTPVPEPDIVKWSDWVSTNNRMIAFDEIGTSRVSTVFLATNHRYVGEGPPILFETMVFDFPLDSDALGKVQYRYATWKEAEVGHQRIVRAVKRLYLDPLSAVAELTP